MSKEFSYEEHRIKEFKISYKKSNADFLENKISAKRASLIFGTNWSNIIKNSTLQLKNYFENRPLKFKFYTFISSFLF